MKFSVAVFGVALCGHISGEIVHLTDDAIKVKDEDGNIVELKGLGKLRDLEIYDGNGYRGLVGYGDTTNLRYNEGVDAEFGLFGRSNGYEVLDGFERFNKLAEFNDYEELEKTNEFGGQEDYKDNLFKRRSSNSVTVGGNAITIGGNAVDDEDDYYEDEDEDNYNYEDDDRDDYLEDYGFRHHGGYRKKIGKSHGKYGRKNKKNRRNGAKRGGGRRKFPVDIERILEIFGENRRHYGRKRGTHRRHRRRYDDSRKY